MARLGKGQVAPGVLKRAKATRESVEKKCKLLREGDTRLSQVNSLENFAAWENADLSIESVSPNSVRKYAAACFPGGLAGLLECLTANCNPEKRAHREKYTTAALTMAQLSELTASIELWSDRYVDLVDRMRNLAATDEGVRRELDAHRRRYDGPGAVLQLVKK